jgi:hypothetical protein
MSRMLLVTVFVVSCAVAVAAHHSAAGVYFMDKPAIKLKGTVTKVQWQNPHIWCYIDVTDETGKVKAWEVEIQANPNALFRQGWTKDSLRVGDVVAVEGYLPRNATLNRVLSRSLILPDGRELGR